VKEDAYDDVPVSVSIEPDRLKRWIDRAEEFVDMIEEMFPDALLLWRTLHYCVVSSGIMTMFSYIGGFGHLDTE
jgi:hypothetical protein